MRKLFAQANFTIGHPATFALVSVDRAHTNVPADGNAAAIASLPQNWVWPKASFDEAAAAKLISDDAIGTEVTAESRS